MSCLARVNWLLFRLLDRFLLCCFLQNEPRRVFSISVSYVEIYNEVIRDLLTAAPPPKGGLKIHEGLGKGLFIGNLTQLTAETGQQVMQGIAEGDGTRPVAQPHGTVLTRQPP